MELLRNVQQPIMEERMTLCNTIEAGGKKQWHHGWIFETTFEVRFRVPVPG